MNNENSISDLSSALLEGDHGEATLLTALTGNINILESVPVAELLVDQRRAFDIVDWHLQQSLSGLNLPQLRMIIPGEAGVGKSKTIQMVSQNFQTRGVQNMLVKAAYTGIAASTIDRQTLHYIAMIPMHGGKQSAKTRQKLETFWRSKQYLIIDEISMISHTFFASLSEIITPLYWQSNMEKDTELEMLGRKLYKQFDVVVQLKTQVRVTDPDWMELLQHVQHG
ncbi:hypothetical protein M404DRAFT_169193, partial [Pisolithus tinctorius Marx 270]